MRNVRVTAWPNGLGYDCHDERTGLSGAVFDDPCRPALEVRVDAAHLGGPVVRLYPRKAWILGQVVDLDVDAAEAFAAACAGLERTAIRAGQVFEVDGVAWRAVADEDCQVWAVRVDDPDVDRMFQSGEIPG